MKALETDITEHEHKMKMLTEKVVQNETQSRCNNLRLFGVDETTQPEDSEKLFKEILHRKMGIALDDRAIARAHRPRKRNPTTNDRMSKSHPQTIIVKLEHYMIFSQRTKIKETGLCIEEYCPLAIDTQMCRLYPIIKAADALKMKMEQCRTR